MTISAILAEHVWWLGVFGFAVIRAPYHIRARRAPVRTDRRDLTEWIVRIVAVIGMSILPFVYILFHVPEFATYPFFPPFLVVGAAAFIGGLWMIRRAHLDLGEYFSGTLQVRPEHQLVTKGVYRYVRHPMYVGFLLWAVAQAFLLPNWVAGPAGLIGFTVFALFRIPREETLMTGEFGDSYRAYMQQTARLVPGIL